MGTYRLCTNQEFEWMLNVRKANAEARCRESQATEHGLLRVE